MDEPRTQRIAPGPRPWPPAAVALNLTGLGLGYLLLRRWWLAAGYLVLTAGLVLLAFATDAAKLPWLWGMLALLWVLVPAAHAGRLASRGSDGWSAPTQGVVPLVVAVVLLVIEMAGYAGYVAAGDRAWETAVAAQARGDCALAAPKFAQVSGIYELTLSPHAAEAADRGRECAVVVAADTARADGRPADAVRAYRAFRTDFPRSALIPAVEAALPRTFAEWGAALRKAGDPARAVGVYRDGLTEPGSEALRPELADTYLESAADVVAALPYNRAELASAASSALDNLLTVRREFADTAAAARVGAGLTALLTELGPRMTTIGSCAALPALAALARVPATQIAEIAEPLARRRAAELSACGLERYRAGALPAAVEAFAEIEKSYPLSPELAQARSARIAADVAIARKVPAPALPAPYTGDEIGPVPVTFYNVASTPVQVLVSGSSVHQIELPACAGCEPDVRLACGSAAGRPSGVLRLRPGTYDVVSRATRTPPQVGTVTAAIVDGEVAPGRFCVSTG